MALESLLMNTHRGDPPTAVRAFNRFKESGALATHQRKVLNSLSKRPGSTAGEVAAGCGLSHVQAQRRLSDLKSAGIIHNQGRRKCQVKGVSMTLWWISNG